MDYAQELHSKKDGHRSSKNSESCHIKCEHKELAKIVQKKTIFTVPRNLRLVTISFSMPGKSLPRIPHIIE